MAGIEGVLALPGARLAYQVTGAGPAVVLVHGFGLDMRMWDRQAAHLAARSQVVRYDARGFGASGPFDPAVRYTHAGDLLALLDHLGIAKAVLAGLLFGGRVVTQAALSAPDQMTGLVLLDSVLDGIPWDPGSAAASGTAVRQARDRGLPAGRAGLAGASAVRRRPPAPAARRSARGDDGRLPGAALDRPDPHKQAGPPPIDTLEKLAMPVLVLVGEHDVPCFKEMSAVLARRIPGARYHLVRGAGHMINMEQPGPVNELLASFLAQLTEDQRCHR